MYVLHHLNVSGPVVIASQAYSHVARACYGISVALLFLLRPFGCGLEIASSKESRERTMFTGTGRGHPEKPSKEQAIQMILA